MIPPDTNIDIKFKRRVRKTTARMTIHNSHQSRIFQLDLLTRGCGSYLKLEGLKNFFATKKRNYTYV